MRALVSRCGASFLAVLLTAWPLASSAQAVLHLSRTAVPFSYVSQGYPSPVQAVFVTNTGDAPLTLNGLTLEGASPGDFALAPGGSCTPFLVLDAAERCRVDLQMSR